MNFRDLQYFVAVADTRHFGKAADRCFVSQPTLSMQLKKLESELDVVLFERDKKQVRLTAKGEKMLVQAQRVLREMYAFKEMSKRMADPLAGEFKLGVIPTLGPYLLPHIVPPMHDGFPKVNFMLYEWQTGVLLDLLKDGSIDAAILALPIGDHGFQEQDLFEEPFYLAVPRHHEYARLDVVPQENINLDELLLLGEGHCLRDHALQVCQITENQDDGDAFNATSLETLRHMVMMGAGITLLPQLSLSYHSHPGITCIPFAEPVPGRRVGMLWRESAANAELIEAVIEMIQRVMAKLPQQ